VKNIILAFILISFLASCGPYSFSGASTGGIRTVYIPVFDNETIEYGLGEELTNKITAAIVADNTLKVVNKDEADAYISGKVISFKKSSETYNKEDQVQEYRVDVTVNVSFVKPNGEAVWEDPRISSFGVYQADTETEDEGKTQALEKLAEIIVNRTVRNW
jgi:outer membrane lipopolysaccharide assembly protein LptE/RlpB